MDANGNIAYGPQQVTVNLVDTVPPVVTPPPDVYAQTSSSSAVVAIGTATAVDNVDGNLPVSSDAPASFPIGVTTVTWTATDAAGNVGTATQKVVISYVSSVGGGGGTVVTQPPAAGGGATVTMEEVYWHHNDHLGTPQALTDANGRIVWTMSQTPFGVATVNEDPDGDGIKVTNNFRFPGQYFDAETGLNYNYFRNYDPIIGAYPQSDPIGLNGGMNPYAYVGENPVSSIDPFGLFQFGTRPLTGTPTAIPLGDSNLGLLHENGFYDNGGNVGYFPSGIGSDNTANMNNYTRSGPFYDDAIMQTAEQNLRKSGNWLPNDPSEPWYSNSNPYDYDVTLHNCQDFTDALRNEYRRLGGDTCQTPFKGGVCNAGQ